MKPNSVIKKLRYPDDDIKYEGHNSLRFLNVGHTYMTQISVLSLGAS